MTRREINTGRGVNTSHLTAVEIAATRQTEDLRLFLDTFSLVRSARTAARIESFLDDRPASPVVEAAVIEALASRRADGIQI